MVSEVSWAGGVVATSDDSRQATQGSPRGGRTGPAESGFAHGLGANNMLARLSVRGVWRSKREFASPEQGGQVS